MPSHESAPRSGTALQVPVQAQQLPRAREFARRLDGVPSQRSGLSASPRQQLHGRKQNVDLEATTEPVLEDAPGTPTG
jgi:hypothetical protein